jgi:hypothetical protein
MKIGGIGLKLGTWQGGLWQDWRDPYYNSTPGYGLVLAIKWGPTEISCPKFWSKTWDSEHYATPENTWFEFVVPFIIGPYFSICLGRVGIYLGFKEDGNPVRNILLPSMKFDIDRYT